MQSSNYVLQFLDITQETAFTRSPTVQKSFSIPAAIAGVQRSELSSVVTPKPANGGQGKTGQRKRPGTKLFYPAASSGGKSVFVRQLRGPHLST